MRTRKSKKDTRHFYLVETERGNNYLMAVTPSSNFSATLRGDKETKRTKLNITHEEHVKFLNQSLTHTLKFDNASGRIVASPKAMTTNNAKTQPLTRKPQL